MRQYHKMNNRTFTPTINIDRLWHLAGAAILAKAKDVKDGTAPVLNVASRGYFKVLGKGRLPDVPLIVKTRSISNGAEKKIKAAGGAVVLTA